MILMENLLDNTQNVLEKILTPTYFESTHQLFVVFCLIVIYLFLLRKFDFCFSLKFWNIRLMICNIRLLISSSYAKSVIVSFLFPAIWTVSLLVIRFLLIAIYYLVGILIGIFNFVSLQSIYTSFEFPSYIWGMLNPVNIGPYWFFLIHFSLTFIFLLVRMIRRKAIYKHIAPSEIIRVVSIWFFPFEFYRLDGMEYLEFMNGLIATCITVGILFLFLFLVSFSGGNDNSGDYHIEGNITVTKK